MSQSAVSTALARLRQKYGDPLFQRVGHGMKATARMRALIRPLREALHAWTKRWPRNRFQSAPPRNALSPSRMSDLGEMVFMPKILQRMRQLAPRAAVRSVAASAAQIERGLEGGEIDLAVGYFPDLREKSFLEKHLFYPPLRVPAARQSSDHGRDPVDGAVPEPRTRRGVWRGPHVRDLRTLPARQEDPPARGAGNPALPRASRPSFRARTWWSPCRTRWACSSRTCT